jgi:predicted RNase H-like nuclease (RuvC/YqgF family)
VAITFHNQYNPYHASAAGMLSQTARLDDMKAMHTPASSAQQLLQKQSEPSSFLAQAQEALVYQRLGVDKEKIDEIKAQIEKLAEQMQQQGADTKALQEKMNELQAMLDEEYQKGRERMDMRPEAEKGKVIDALV